MASKPKVKPKKQSGAIVGEMVKIKDTTRSADKKSRS
jgi:hypothetical protein